MRCFLTAIFILLISIQSLFAGIDDEKFYHECDPIEWSNRTYTKEEREAVLQYFHQGSKAITNGVISSVKEQATVKGAMQLTLGMAGIYIGGLLGTVISSTLAAILINGESCSLKTVGSCAVMATVGSLASCICPQGATLLTQKLYPIINGVAASVATSVAYQLLNHQKLTQTNITDTAFRSCVLGVTGAVMGSLIQGGAKGAIAHGSASSFVGDIYNQVRGGQHFDPCHSLHEAGKGAITSGIVYCSMQMATSATIKE